jgi:hypothetical protein
MSIANGTKRETDAARWENPGTLIAIRSPRNLFAPGWQGTRTPLEHQQQHPHEAELDGSAMRGARV